MQDRKHFWIEFIGDRSVKIAKGQSILSASLEAGIPHYHACGGQGKCSTCRVLVKDGAEHITPANKVEQELSKKISLPKNVRLACQSFAEGSPIRLHRIIRDEEDMALYIRDEDDKQRQQEVPAMGEEKELALFFLDIRDFTPFMQAYLPFDIIHIMRRLFTIFRTGIEENKGTIIETAGDGLYAVFGLDGDDTAKACNHAVQAGYRILKDVLQFNRDYLEIYFNHFFEIGIGLHVGKTIVGNIGLGINNNLTVMGLPVNIASRLQNATKQLNNSFVVSNDAVKFLDAKAEEEKIRTIRLKGIAGKFKVHLLGEPFEHRNKNRELL